MVINELEQKLINEAKRAMEFSYSPYSKFSVGAALYASKSKEDCNLYMYKGCNIENASYGATICAERTAAVKAISEGMKYIKEIAIVSTSGQYTYPCGICRQFLSEFMDSESTILLYNSVDNEIKKITINDVFPNSFFGFCIS